MLGIGPAIDRENVRKVHFGYREAGPLRGSTKSGRKAAMGCDGSRAACRASSRTQSSKGISAIWYPLVPQPSDQGAERRHLGAGQMVGAAGRARGDGDVADRRRAGVGGHEIQRQIDIGREAGVRDEPDQRGTSRSRCSTRRCARCRRCPAAGRSPPEGPPGPRRAAAPRPRTSSRRIPCAAARGARAAFPPSPRGRRPRRSPRAPRCSTRNAPGWPGTWPASRITSRVPATFAARSSWYG